MRNGHGGARRGAGRPMGRRNLRPIGALQSILREDEKHLGLIPVEFSGDSLEFLRATMMGKIWPTREQIYAAKSIYRQSIRLRLPLQAARLTRYAKKSEKNLWVAAIARITSRSFWIKYGAFVRRHHYTSASIDI